MRRKALREGKTESFYKGRYKDEKRERKELREWHVEQTGTL